tara:strand:+ start:210 stop:398 length:189 start_codon:yes stop_codon:yes gene_type:complete
MGINQNVVCWCEGDTCPGCDHYYGKADVCVYKPKSGFWVVLNDLGRWLMRISQNRLEPKGEE